MTLSKQLWVFLYVILLEKWKLRQNFTVQGNLTLNLEDKLIIFL